MKLKGVMTIELTDESTGEVETVTEENMITEAVNNILGLNPMGIFYKATDEYDTMVNWADNLLPICPNMIGGILCFSKALTEDASHIYELSDNLPVAYASNNVNDTVNTARGSMNLTESMVLTDGYKFVWEFTPSQGNGTIAAVALTSALGGRNAYGSIAADASTFLDLKEVKLDDIEQADQMMLFEMVEVDFENNLAYSISYGSNTVVITKMRLPIFNIGLNEKLDDTTFTVLETQTLTPSTFKLKGSYTRYGDFFDGKDGYWYGFANQSNSSGSASMNWIKISKTDYSFTEGTWTLSNAKLKECGSRKKDDSYPKRNITSVLRNGYLYVPAYDATGIYKINVSNSADVTLIPFGFTSTWKPLCEAGSCEVYAVLVGDLIIGRDFQVTVNDAVIQTAGEVRLNDAASPMFQYKNFLFQWGGSYGNEYRTAYLLTPYLASINNLGSAVVKDANKTMKITYTLTEQT